MRIGVIGLGLIGGSFALAIRRAHPSAVVVGTDRDEAAIDAALQRGVVDAAATLPELGACDALMIAVPVRQMPELFARLSSHLQSNCVVTDAGSTKGAVIEAARTTFGAHVAQFVPGHPIAGRERSGVGAAAGELFEARHVVLTPLEENDPAAIDRVEQLWQSCGARVVRLEAGEHDRVFAAVSHLPHIIAFALVDELAARPNARQLFTFAASGFRDFTRIAGSSPDMWRDIALDNGAALAEECRRIEERLAALRRAIEARDGETLHTAMQRARAAREHWMAGELAGFRDDAA
ncbi:MAG: prephenate dehydrogenase/arogenate dehydrogenase family protein [Betaproteobacteria bacterium]|nr:prephenate dehydrogenase/arogenate dehydrogenase family protein [Betaproteobacteria bacterium]